MSRPRLRFEGWLRERGLRMTAARRVVLDHVFRHFGHFRAADLVDSLREHDAPISRATVYRTLPQLVEAGLLRRHDLGNRETFYEPEYGRQHHEHMVCVACGKIFEFVAEEIEKLQDEICHRHRFEALSHTLQIHGLCRNCRRAGSRDRTAVGARLASAGETGGS